jgi:hyperosmotically inducible protein
MRKVFALLLVLAILGGAGYYAYTRNWGPADWVKRKLGLAGDAKTSSNVRAALALSRRVSPFKISVQTQEGVVTLTGNVPSEDVKSLAGEIARDTAGVQEVNNEITVDRSMQPGEESGWVDDLKIRAAILEKLARSPELGGKAIDVKVQDRIVELTGQVDTPAQREGAEQVARAAEGVAGVTNQLAVANPLAPTEPPSKSAPIDPNADLAKRVKFDLYETGAFDLSTLNAAAQEGTVTLTGRVRTKAEKLLATFVAQGTPGTKKVVNELEVKEATPSRK